MINKDRGKSNYDVIDWLTCSEDNQWKLIDALRYGYEAEPEPRWGIKAGNCYMNDPFDFSFTNNVEYSFVFDTKESAEETVNELGFGEVVDLNKEGKDDD